MAASAAAGCQSLVIAPPSSVIGIESANRKTIPLWDFPQWHQFHWHSGYSFRKHATFCFLLGFPLTKQPPLLPISLANRGLEDSSIQVCLLIPVQLAGLFWYIFSLIHFFTLIHLFLLSWTMFCFYQPTFSNKCWYYSWGSLYWIEHCIWLGSQWSDSCPLNIGFCVYTIWLTDHTSYSLWAP